MIDTKIEIPQREINRVKDLERGRTAGKAMEIIRGEDEKPEKNKYHIKTSGLPENPSPKTQAFLDEALEFAQSLSDVYQEKFTALATKYRRAHPGTNFTADVEQELKNRGYDLPLFQILSGEPAQSFLKGQELPATLNSDEIIVAFNFPKPIARFWYRGGLKSDDPHAKPVPPENIPWGHFFREMAAVVWKFKDDFFNHQKSQIFFNRLNPANKHKSYQYYYVWRIIGQNPGSSIDSPN